MELDKAASELETPSLLAFMESEKKTAEVVDEQPEVTSGQEPEAEVTSGTETEESGSEVESDEQDSSEPAQANAETAWIRAVLAEKNIDLDGLSDDDLREAILQEFGEQEKPSRQVAEVKDETPPPSPVTDDKESTKGEGLNKDADRSIAKLEYDARLAALVTIDEHGNAVPKPEHGEQAKEAAKQINDYSSARRKRVEELVNDPIGFLMADIKREMQSLVGNELKQFRDEQQTVAQKQVAQRMVQEESERVAAILKQNEPRFYKVDSSGKPRLSLKTRKPMLTEFGSQVDAEFLELKAINPQALDSVLLDKALRTVEQFSKAAAAPTEVAKEVADKKKQFLAKDRTNTQTNHEADREPAKLSERLELGGGTSLLDAIAENPDLVDNPVVARIRQQRQNK